MRFLVSAVIIAGVGYMLAQKYKPQGVLLIGGFALMICTVVFGLGTILPAKQSTGFVWFDIFEALKKLLSVRLAGLGLTIMTIGGFVRYMERIGANRSLVELVIRPLRLVHSPMAILMSGYVISQIVTLFVPSHAGIGLLLMLTMYPVFIKSGVSKLSALAVIATSKFTDIGPISSNAILAAHTAKMDPTVYFLSYQLPVILPAVIAVGVAHYFVQPWWDKREGVAGNLADASAENDDGNRPPLIYAILPTLPLLLVVVFCPLVVSSIKMDVITAMLICTIMAMAFEFIRIRDIHSVLENFMTFFDGMAKQFYIVVSLIIAGEFFGNGLLKIGVVDSLIQSVMAAGFGLKFMILVISAVMMSCAFLMGSGNAAFFAFAGLAPKIAAYLKVDSVVILLPMELTSGFGRCMSPITAAIVAIAGVAGASPFDVAKRCAIPVAAAAVTYLATTFIIYF